MKLQNHDELVYIDEFASDMESPYDGIFPKGARDKDVKIAPPSAPYHFIIGGHRYLFKQSYEERYPDQFWIELAAYRFGALVGVPVPPAFVAYDSVTGKYGALIEWFYGYAGEPPQTYYDGGVYMMRLIPDYDPKLGQKHNFTTIAHLFRETLPREDKVECPNWLSDLAKVLTFDALIGNTDRHQENWGLLISSTTDGDIGRLSPAFDNGTSMGHEIVEKKFANFEVEDRLNTYIGKGKHHMRWHQADEKRLSHCSFIVKLLEEYPELAEVVKPILSFNKDEVVKLFFDLCRFDVGVPFTPERARLCLALLFRRRDVLAQAIGAI